MRSSTTRPAGACETHRPPTSAGRPPPASLASGVVADGSTVASSYKRFLAFLGAGVVQLSSNTVHDRFNGESLWVSSKAHPEPFQIWGDNTMIRGGDGYRFANAAAQLSQRSIQEILANGSTLHTGQEISDHFPTKVHDNAQNRSRLPFVRGLGLRFERPGGRLVRRPEEPGRRHPTHCDSSRSTSTRWAAGSGRRSRVRPATSPSVATGRCGLSGSTPQVENGPVHYWDTATSTWKNPKAGGAGVRIAAGGDGVVWVVNSAGNSYCARPHQVAQWEMGDVVTIDGVSGLVDIAAGSDGSVWGLAKATVSGGHQLLRCIRGSGRHSWERIAGGATNISVGPDGLPWVVNSNGVLMRLVPSKGQDRYQDKDAQWPNITPAGRKAKDIGLGTGSMMSAFVTTDQGIYGWNGRLPTSSGTAMPDWEDCGRGGGAGRNWPRRAPMGRERLTPTCSASAHEKTPCAYSRRATRAR